MRTPPPVVILRHPKERISKCSLEPLRGKEGFTFLTAREGFTFDAGGHTLLGFEGPLLSPADAERPLLVLDATWRLLPRLERCLRGEPLRRSLPRGLRTAYPRVSKITADPSGGLASVEALYAAFRFMGFDGEGILDGYRWAREFLERNREILGAPPRPAP